MTAYVIAQMAVHDVEMYREYAMAVMQTIDGSGGKVVAANDVEVYEGTPAHPRIVIGEFPSMEFARAWYSSDAYQAIKHLRVDATTSVLFMVEGLTLPPEPHNAKGGTA